MSQESVSSSVQYVISRIMLYVKHKFAFTFQCLEAIVN